MANSGDSSSSGQSSPARQPGQGPNSPPLPNPVAREETTLIPGTTQQGGGTRPEASGTPPRPRFVGGPSSSPRRIIPTGSPRPGGVGSSSSGPLVVVEGGPVVTGSPAQRKRPLEEGEIVGSGSPTGSGVPGVNQCSVCWKVFDSSKGLHGHMRAHPDRDWKGVLPPPNFTKAEFSAKFRRVMDVVGGRVDPDPNVAAEENIPPPPPPPPPAAPVQAVVENLVVEPQEIPPLVEPNEPAREDPGAGPSGSGIKLRNDGKDIDLNKSPPRDE